MDWKHILIFYLTIGVITASTALSIIPHQRFGIKITDPATILLFLLIGLGWPVFLGAVVYSTFTSPDPRFTVINTTQPVEWTTVTGHDANVAMYEGQPEYVPFDRTEHPDDFPQNPQESSEASDDEP